MTAAVTITDNTVRADDVVLKLDALVQGYEEVLSIAKQQLEEFSISDDDWARIYGQLSRRIDYYDLSRNITESLMRGLDYMRQDPNGEQFTFDFDYRFARTLMGQLKLELERAIRSHLISDAIKLELDAIRTELRQELRELAASAAKDAVEHISRDQVRTADRQRDLIRELLNSCFGPELRTMVREAATQVSS